METLTFQQSTIHGTVLGKPVMCKLRGSPAGLQLPAGNYLLLPAVNSPIYGRALSIQPLGAAGSPAETQDKSPSQYDLRPGGTAVKFTNPSAVKFSPSAVKFSATAVKFTDPSAIKFTDRSGAPAIKFDSAGSQMAQAVVISERAIAGGNSFIAIAGFDDLIDVVQRAGGVTLVVM